MSRDPRVDDYIAKAAQFAQPILEHMREIALRALPDAEESIKWGMPHFLVQGKNVAGMAAFKSHCAFTIHGEGRQGEGGGMGQYGRICSLSDVPGEAELTAKLTTARQRVLDQGTALRKPLARASKPEIAMPDDFGDALANDGPAHATFAALTPSHRREYLEWITEAKTPATRDKRIATSIGWLAEGKKRNWKYEKR
jgi:uncharacterized protein YdeI (YjbR/CyaY-like superfamily)